MELKAVVCAGIGRVMKEINNNENKERLDFIINKNLIVYVL